MTSSWNDMIDQMILHAPDPDQPLPLSNQKSTIYSTTVLFLVISWLAVGLRLWVRLRVVREPGWDDFFVVVAAGMNTAATSLVLTSIEHGLGQHFLYIGLDNQVMYTKLFYFENAIYVTQTAVIKISLLCQYLRIFKAGMMRWICISLLVILSVWGITYSVLAWVPCFPIRAYWARAEYENPRCYGFGFRELNDFVSLFESHTALNMLFDLTIFLTPMVLFSKPNLKPKNLFAMAGVFILGAVVVFTSVWRLYTIVHNRAATYPYIDFTWWTPISIILSCLEIDLAIMCASMPIFWPLVENAFNGIFVTHEVRIIAEDRGFAYELEHTNSKGAERRNSIQSDSAASRRSLTREPSQEDTADHYKDQYVISQVDPFATDHNGGLMVETNVHTVPKESPRWRI